VTVTYPLESIDMLRRDPSRTTTISDWELGIAAVLLLVAVVLTTLVVPGVV
jgi:hypothetical protein